MPRNIYDIKKNKSLNQRCLIVVLVIVFSIASCRKLIEANAPRTSLSQVNVYNSDVAAISVLTGIYQQINQENVFSGNNGISLIAGLSADEFTLSSAVSSTDLKRFHYIDSLFSNNTGSRGAQYWSKFFNYIFECNSAIEGITASDKLTFTIKQHLLGEAKFMRAFFNFYLLNLYGDLPIVLSTEWTTNSRLFRSSEAEVYNQIISDLKDAQDLLDEQFLDGKLQPYGNNAERVRPTKWAATALLSRVYLYSGDWSNAEIEATTLINNTALFNLPSLNKVFLKNSVETIWQLQPVMSGRNTLDAELFLLPSAGPSSTYPVYLSPHLLTSFEPNDQRRFNRNWVDSIKVGTNNPLVYYFSYKYKAGVNPGITQVTNLSEYLMVFRLGEQYLIRSEARANLGNINGAQIDLNAIRKRSGLDAITAADKNSLLSAILNERQVELFSEWGHRWFDLKRTGSVDAVMNKVRPLKSGGAPWKPYMKLYPILIDDILKNSNLVQNPGY